MGETETGRFEMGFKGRTDVCTVSISTDAAVQREKLTVRIHLIPWPLRHFAQPPVISSPQL